MPYTTVSNVSHSSINVQSAERTRHCALHFARQIWRILRTTTTREADEQGDLRINFGVCWTGPKQLVGRNTETTHSPRTKFHPSFNEP